MKLLSAVTAAGALTLACAGCSGSFTAAVAPGSAGLPPHLRSATARLADSSLVVEVRTDRCLLDVRDHDLQVFVDSDDDPGTGYGAHGDEYVARLIESRDSIRFPLRRTGPADPADPAGWGAVSGGGWIGYDVSGLRLSMPLSALGHHHGRMRVRVELYAGGTFDYRDATTDPPLIAAR